MAEVPPPNDQEVERQPPDESEDDATDWVESQAAQLAEPQPPVESPPQRPGVDAPPRVEEQNPEARAMLADVPIIGTDGGGAKPAAKFFDRKPNEADMRLTADGIKPEQIERATARLNEIGQDPRKMILDAVKNSRVVAIGETHTVPNGLQEDGTALMSQMKAAGLTHLAVEVKKDQQGMLDDFLSGKITSDEFKKNFFGTTETNGRGDDWMKMMKTAHDAGIKVVAVDDYDDLGAHIDQLGIDPKVAERRDNAMAGGVADIIDKDPRAKVMLWLGSDHLEQGTGRYGNETAGELLRQKAAKDGFNLTVISAQLEDLARGDNSAGALAGMAGRPVAFNTAAAGGEVQDLLGTRGKKFENVILYPKDHALNVLQQEVGSNDPRVLRKMEQTALSYAGDGSVEKAVAMQERAQALAKTLYGENSPQYVASQTRMGQVYDQLKQPDQARKQYEAAIERAMKLPGGTATRELIEAVSRLESQSMTKARFRDGVGAHIEKIIPAIADNKDLYQQLRRDANLNSNSKTNPLVVADQVIETLRFLGKHDRAREIATQMLQMEKKHEEPGSYHLDRREEQINNLNAGPGRRVIDFKK